ncbi:MAG: hypothetical protein RLZZ369_2285, partial [Pseudomonadota bacterium]
MLSTRPQQRPNSLGSLHAVASGVVLCLVAQSGLGLALGGQGLWPHWEGRVGVMMDRPTNPLKDTYVLFQPVPNGLNIRGLHLLSDYYFDGGFRATAGMVRGEATQSLWDGGGEGLNISLQRL